MKTLEIHLIQSVPPSRLNRGENGDPKTSVFGGVPRTRVSSQAQKRVQRDQTTKRTRLPHELILNALPQDVRDALRGVVIDAVGHRYGKFDEAGRLRTMVYLSEEEVQQMADLLLAQSDALQLARSAVGESKNKAAAAAYSDALAETMKPYKPQVSEQHGLFGRFMADVPEEMVQAATSYTHAISTHRDATANDFFTAKDDHDQTIAHIGNLGLSAPTLYRNAVVDLSLLAQHLGADRVNDAVKRWALGFAFATPTGGGHGAFAQTLPEYALLILREHGQPVTLANAFSEPAYPKDGQSLLEVSVQKLKAQVAFNQRAYGHNGITKSSEVSVRPFEHDEFTPNQATSLEAALSHLGF